MVNITGLTGAVPIWHDFMISAIGQLKSSNPTPFNRPANIVDRAICAVSGTEPSPYCPSQRMEVFAADQPPLLASQDLWTTVKVDTWTNLLASSACSDFSEDAEVINVTDLWAKSWLTQDEQGISWALQMGFQTPLIFTPERECRVDDSRPFLSITIPADGQNITTSPIDIFGRADASTDFASWQLDYGIGSEPANWTKLAEGSTPISQPELLNRWDISSIPVGDITLRLTVYSISGTKAELIVHVNIQSSE
jgi:hypothetical protein